MKTLIIILLSFLGLFCKPLISGAQKLDPRITSLFVYNFTHYVEWPQKEDLKEFSIGVVGTSTIYQELINVAKIKKVGTKSISIKSISPTALEEMKSVQILVVAESESSKIKAISESLKGLPTLVVSEKMGLAKKGAGISLYLDEEDEFKTKFEMNKASVEAQGLKVAPNLVALAVLVK